MSKGKLSRLMKKIDAVRKAGGAIEATSTMLEAAYSVRVNGRKFRALGHNTTAEFFIISEDSGKLIFFPQRRLRRVIIGAEYQEIMRQRALANVPKPPKNGDLTMVRRPDLIRPGMAGPAPEDEGA